MKGLTSPQINRIITGIFFSGLFVALLASSLINDIKKNKEKDESRFSSTYYIPIVSILAFTALATLMKSGIIPLKGFTGPQINGLIAGAFFIMSLLLVSSSYLIDLLSSTREAIKNSALDKEIAKRNTQEGRFSMYEFMGNITSVDELDVNRGYFVVSAGLTVFTILATLMDNGVFKGLDHLTTHQRGGAIFAVFVGIVMLTAAAVVVSNKCSPSSKIDDPYHGGHNSGLLRNFNELKNLS